MTCDKNVEKYTNDQLSHYERIAVEQTKAARTRAKMEKSISSHSYQLEQLRHSHAVDEYNRARSNSILIASALLCSSLLAITFAYFLFL